LSDEPPETWSEGAVKLLSSKRQWGAAAVLVLLILFLLRPGASRLKSRIISSISAGVGRPVDIGSVHVRLLPRPGFEIENLVIYDDPSYGAEPMLRASEVTADLRIISLIKGRLDVARLNLTEPSFNLVHRDGGGWNLQALLERAAHNSTAPTGAARSLPRPHFPYIEGSSGRINFKSGAEKHPYALTNADFSLWQESEDTWGIRLKAQPFRTDLNLMDVGELRVDGTWKRAESFRETPLELSVEWSKGQLGQLTKFFTGMDKGWRGDVQLDASLSGSPAKLKITSTAWVDDFRRFDITSGRALRLAARCDGEYSSATYEFRDVMCSAPVGEGGLTLTGDMGLPGSRHYSISLKAENIPAAAALALVERAKKNIPDDLVAEGTLKGAVGIEQNAAAGTSFRFHGQGEIADLRLSSATTKAEVGPATVPFVLVDDSAKTGDQRKQRIRLGLVFPKVPHLEIGPVALTQARGGATAAGWLTRSSYSLSVVGESEIARALRLARTIGIPAAGINPEGSAQLNLQIAGTWVGFGEGLGIAFPAPEVTGTAKLRNVRVTIRGASEPLEISSAEMQLMPEKVQVRKLNARAVGAEWTGSLEMPRGCGTPDACPIQFSLNTQELALTRMDEWINGRQKTRPWYQVLQPTSKPGQSVLGRLQASGQVSANRFSAHGVTATNVAANVRFDSGKLELNAIEGDLFNGKLRGKWEIEFGSASPICGGSGDITGIAVGRNSGSVSAEWVSGTASGNYEIKGPCSAEFWQSAEGKVRAEVRNGTLPHIALGDDAVPLGITRLNAQAQLDSGKFEIRSAKLNSPQGTYDISGTVSVSRDLDLKMTRVPADSVHSGYSVTGTLAQPHVSPLASTEQARLKPLPSK
jgi:uncharacterized protein involved in outer membrane biogenesis